MCDYVGQHVQWVKTEILTTTVLLLKSKKRFIFYSLQNLKSEVTQTGTHLPGRHTWEWHRLHGNTNIIMAPMLVRISVAWLKKGDQPAWIWLIIHPTCRLVGSIHSPEGYKHSRVRVDLSKFRLLSGGTVTAQQVPVLFIAPPKSLEKAASPVRNGNDAGTHNPPDTESRRLIVVAQVLHKVSDLHFFFFFFFTGAKKTNRQLKV